MLEQRVAHIRSKSLRRDRGTPLTEQRAPESDRAHSEHERTAPQDIAYIRTRDALIDDVRHHEGDEQF